MGDMEFIGGAVTEFISPVNVKWNPQPELLRHLIIDDPNIKQ